MYSRGWLDYFDTGAWPRETLLVGHGSSQRAESAFSVPHKRALSCSEIVSILRVRYSGWLGSYVLTH
jgi:hypothetical protein